MRRRWHIPPEFWIPIPFLYGLGWIPGIIAGEAVDGERGIDIVLAAWFGPVLIAGAGYGLWLMWQHRPRRTVEAVTTDMRVGERPGGRVR